MDAGFLGALFPELFSLLSTADTPASVFHPNVCSVRARPSPTVVDWLFSSPTDKGLAAA